MNAIDALVQAALARALDRGGDLDSALASLGRADPLLRAAARRRLRAVHADALLATHDKHADRGRHALRLAYLLLGRVLPAGSACEDAAAVEALYEGARSRAPSGGGFWWATAGVLVLICSALGGALAMSRWHSSSGAWMAVTERAGPAPRGAFATGGVPAPLPGDAIIRRVFAADVPAFLVALDRWSDARRRGADLTRLEADMAAARASAAGPEATAALGEGTARALDALLSAARAAAERPAGTPGDPADLAVSEASAALDDELAALGAGYFLDGDAIHDSESGRRLVLAYAFTVERVRLFAVGGAAPAQTVRALHVRRLDHLNWTHTLLGFTRPHLSAALVLLDKLDEQVISLIAPGLVPGAPVTLFEPDAPAEERGAVEARAGEVAREEYGALPGTDVRAVVRLGELLGRRRAIFEDWERRAAARGLALAAPAKLKLPSGFSKALEGFATPEELAQIAEIDAGLATDTAAAAFASLRDALAASVERHEVEHRIDARRRPVMPKELERRVGPLERDGKERRGAVTARAELTAYLAELARDPQTVRFGLTMVMRFLFDRRQHGTAERHAALVIADGLAAELELAHEQLLASDGAVDRPAASRLYLALSREPPARLRAAAEQLWERLFGAPLPELRGAERAPLQR